MSRVSEAVGLLRQIQFFPFYFHTFRALIDFFIAHQRNKQNDLNKSFSTKFCTISFEQKSVQLADKCLTKNLW